MSPCQVLLTHSCFSYSASISSCASLFTQQMMITHKCGDQTNTNHSDYWGFMSKAFCQTQTQTGTYLLWIGSIHFLVKNSHLCLIVCFTSSSEHTISNRLNAGPLTQTGFPDGGRLFHSTGKQQGGGLEEGHCWWRWGEFLQMEWATVLLICPTLIWQQGWVSEPWPTGLSHWQSWCTFNSYYPGLTKCSLFIDTS